MYRYNAIITRVIDGDTFTAEVDLGFYLHQTQIIRLAHVDAPEMRGEERQSGIEARAFVMRRIGPGSEVEIESYKVGSFGRFVADVFYGPDRTSLAQEMLYFGIADPYPLVSGRTEQ